VFQVVKVFVAAGGLLHFAEPAQGNKGTPARARSWKTLRGSSGLDMNAALAQVALPIAPVAFGRRGEQFHGPSLQRDETLQPLALRRTGWVLRRVTI